MAAADSTLEPYARHINDWRMNVAAIIMDDAGHVLLGKPPGGSKLHFPQGGVKAKESLTEAVLREVREEVGLTHCSVLAQYAGLRYPYRRKNEKSKRWLGQQQTYYLLHCPGYHPAVDCSGSAEFDSALWLPPQELTPQLFVSFKRAAVMQALTHFFPPGEPCTLPAIAHRCTTQRYLYSPGLPLPSPLPTPLFAGKRVEALYHLAHSAPLKLHKSCRLLVIITGMQGCGIKKCLRHIAHSLDPLSTRYHLYPADYCEATPAPGELRFLVLHPAKAKRLNHFEAAMQADGVQVVKIALHLSRAKQLRRLTRKGDTPDPPWDTARTLLADFLTATPTHPWHLIPADHGWYRDFLILSILTHRAGNTNGE